MARPITRLLSQFCSYPLATLLLSALLLGLMPGNASANSGPPRYVGDGGGLLLPGKSEQVHILSEALRFDLSTGLNEAQVSARYTLVNRGEALAGQPFIFVIQTSDVGGKELDFAATWQGVPVPSAEVARDTFTEAEIVEMEREWTTVDTLVDPVTGESYREKDYYGRAGLRFFRFELDLPTGVQADLVVTYRHVAALDRVRYVNRVFYYQYLLLPAQGWASFGPLEISVVAPAGKRYYFASNLPFEPDAAGYRASFDGLPGENLVFAVMDKAGVIGGLVRSRVPYYWIGFALLLPVALAIGYVLGRLGGLVVRPGGVRTATMAALLLAGLGLNQAMAYILLHAFPVLRYDYLGVLLTGIQQALGGTLLTGIVTFRVARARWPDRTI